MPKVHRLGDLAPNDCLILKNVRSEYQHWNWFNEKGYIKYYSRDGKTRIFEHRLVAERAFGVDLNRRIHVHHKNDIRNDNRADNLQLLSITEHASLHHRNQVIATCDTCGKTFGKQPSHYHRHKYHYCSDTCRIEGTRKAIRPSAEKLKLLIVEINNFCELGRMFGVCDNTIRNWAEGYGISLTKRKRALDGSRTRKPLDPQF